MLTQNHTGGSQNTGQDKDNTEPPNGVKPEDLIEPTQNDITSEDDFKQLWRGKWKYNPCKKRKIKKYKDNQRWVYVGNGS